MMADLWRGLLLLSCIGVVSLCLLILVTGLIGDYRRARSRPTSARPAATPPDSIRPMQAPTAAVRPSCPKPPPSPDTHLGVTMDDVDAYLRGDPEQDSFKKGQINAMMEDLNRWQQEHQQPKKQGKD